MAVRWKNTLVGYFIYLFNNTVRVHIPGVLFLETEDIFERVESQTDQGDKWEFHHNTY